MVLLLAIANSQSYHVAQIRPILVYRHAVRLIRVVGIDYVVGILARSKGCRYASKRKSYGASIGARGLWYCSAGVGGGIIVAVVVGVEGRCCR